MLGVLITYHSERELLMDCLISLFNASKVPCETIVYDDASRAPAAEYVPRYLPVRVIHGPINRGPAHGRNVLLQAARSKYIHFHDADDLFEPHWCESVSRAVETSSPDAIFTEITSFRDQQRQCERVLGLKALLDGADLVRFCVQGGMLTPAGTYRRENVLAIGGYREQLWQSEDYDFHVRLAASGIRYEIIDEPLVRIRIRTDSRSQNRVEVWTSALDAIRFLANELDPQYKPDLAEKAVQVGSILFKAGAREEARLAFRTAQELGPPTYNQQRRLYGLVARSLGPEAAERFGQLYRGVVFQSGRKFLAERGF
jgi:GT2 family glycosyltransferase